MHPKLLLLPLLVATASAASAQAPLDTTVALPPAVVEDERPESTAASHLQRTVIGSSDLQSLPIRDVADALDKRSTAFVSRHGPSGLSTASFRGLGGRHTAVFLDGLLLSDPQSNQIDLAVVPVVMLESIEVTHGPGSAASSSGSLGGSITLNTVQPAEAFRARLETEVGDFGRRRLGLVGATATGPVSLSVAGEVNRYEGDYPYQNPTILDPSEQIRSGADKSSESLYASAGYEHGGSVYTLSGWVNSVERGLPGPANAPPSEARQWDDNLRLWLASEHRLDEWRAGFGVVGQRTSLRYLNSTNGTDQETTTETADLQASLSRIFGSNVLARIGVQGVFDRTTGVSDERFSGFSDATIDRGRVSIFPSIRFEAYSAAQVSNTAFVPRVGTRVSLTGGSAIQLRANVGRAFRPPSFLERYWQPGGNPDLKPESGWSLDGGVVFQQKGERSAIRLELGAFYADLDDQIVWFPSVVASGLQIWRPFNVGQVRTSGGELSVDVTVPLGPVELSIGGSATRSSSVDRSNESAPSYEKQLRYAPTFVSSAFAGIRVEPISIDASLRHVGRRYITSDESMSLDAYAVLDTQLGYRIRVGHTTAVVAIQVENLLDAQYSVIRFYPMPPRSVALRIGVEV